MARKPLLHAENIPLIGLDGKSKNRRKAFYGGGRKTPERRETAPPCKWHPGHRVELDAFGRFTDKCSLCRSIAVGVDP